MRPRPACLPAFLLSSRMQVLNQSSVSNNTGSEGGAVRCRHVAGVAVTDGSSCSLNRATSGSGGALLAADFIDGMEARDLTVSGSSRVEGNVAAQQGGAFWTQSEFQTVAVSDSSSLSGNAASGDGGAIRVRHADALVVEGGSSVNNNSAYNDVFRTGSGGAFFVESPDALRNITLVAVRGPRSSMNGNRAYSGGGALFTRGRVDALIVSDGGSVDGNFAENDGGGAARLQHLTVFEVTDGSSVSGNMVVGTLWGGDGGAVYAEGVWEWRMERLLVANGSRVDGNWAAQGGGAFFTRIPIGTIQVGACVTRACTWGLRGLVRLCRFEVVRALGQAAHDAQRTTRMPQPSPPLPPFSRLPLVSRLPQFPALPRCCVRPAAQVTLGSSVSANTANSSDGGAVRCRHADSIAITGSSTVTSNTAPKGRGGAVMLEGIDGVKVARVEVVGGSRLDGNAARSGGAIGTDARIAVVSLSGRSSMSGNNATAEQGGCVKARSLDQLTVTGGSRVDNNSALFAEGGAFHMWDEGATDNATTVVVSGNSSISGNFAGRGGGAALWVGTAVSEFSVTDGSCVCDNAAGGADNPYNPGELLRADSGGAIAFRGRVGAISVTHGSCMCRNQILVGNRGGAFNLQQGVDSITVCHGSQLSNNSAAGDSGAFHTRADTPAYALGALTVCNGSGVDFNQARGAYGGVFMGEGRLGNISITSNSSMSSNMASLRGGAMHFSYLPDSFLLRDSCAVNNSAVFEQGAFLYINVSWTGPTYLHARIR